MRNHVRLLVGALAFLTVGCGPEATSPGDQTGTTRSLTATFQVSGAITGPGGASICSVVAGTVRVRLYPPTGSYAATQNICTTSNTYTLVVPEGTYYLQVALPVSVSLGKLPIRSLDPVPLVVTADMVRDFQVEEGSLLGGGMTLDGVPVNADGFLSINHGPLTNVPSTSARTLASGAWYEPLLRSTVYLQNGASYRLVPTCQMLAADMATPPPEGPLVFPTDFSSVSCDFTSNTAGTRTHFNDRLVVTADAGDFGAQARGQVALRGRGWGTQFPVGAGGPVHFPFSANLLYQGGLLFGFESGKELSTTDMSGYGCGPTCADFDVSALPAISQGADGKVISWRYSDAASPESEGLQVSQWSYDAQDDYALFHFVLRNTTRQSKTFWVGAFMDWDLGTTPLDDWIQTTWGGALMMQMDPVGGSRLGTVLIGQGNFRTYAYGANPTCRGEATASQRVDALMGRLHAPELMLNNCDKRYIHGVGPITVEPGHQVPLGVALVAGDDFAGFQDAALAASTRYNHQLGHVGAAVNIDIYPGSTSNSINTKSGGMVPVAIVGNQSIYVPDVTQIDVSTLAFGPGGAWEPHDLSDPAVFAAHLQDANGDGLTDLIVHFRTRESGLTPGTTRACVNGVTLGGIVFDGCDGVTVK